MSALFGAHKCMQHFFWRLFLLRCSAKFGSCKVVFAYLCSLDSFLYLCLPLRVYLLRCLICAIYLYFYDNKIRISFHANTGCISLRTRQKSVCERLDFFAQTTRTLRSTAKLTYMPHKHIQQRSVACVYLHLLILE